MGDYTNMILSPSCQSFCLQRLSAGRNIDYLKYFQMKYLFLLVQVILYMQLIIVYWVECSPIARETRVQPPVESYQRLKKWYLICPCLTLNIIRYISRVKWSNPRKEVAPFPTPLCSRYWKRILWVINLLTYIHCREVKHRDIGPAVRVFANGPGDLGSIPGRSHTKDFKNGTWYHLA